MQNFKNCKKTKLFLNMKTESFTADVVALFKISILEIKKFLVPHTS
jgi:hypothetical protein